jgi:p-methyltransferase
MSRDVDLILIAQSETVNYGEYSKLPLDRIDLYSEIVFPRMVHYNGAFRSHADMINIVRDGISFQNAPDEMRRHLLSIWNLPSLVGMHMANHLLGEGFRTCVINNFDSEWERFCAAYRDCRKPPLVGVSSTFHLGYTELRRICRKLREFETDIEIVVGGAYVNGLMQTETATSFEKLMRRYGIDYVLHGFHSERDLSDLLRIRVQGGDISAVGNLVYLDHGMEEQEKFLTTQQKWNAPLLDDIPALWDELDLPFVNHTMQMRTSCGCPFSCAFCSYPKVARGFKTMNTQAVKRSLESVLNIPGVNRIVFVDDTFNVPPKRFKELCRLFAKYDFEWHSFLRVQFVDEDTVKLMEDSGCSSVYLGIESANDQVLCNMNKRATRKVFEQGVALLRKHHIASVAAFVLGFPGETEHTIRDNRDFIENSGVEYYTLKEFYYMEHAPIHADREKYGLRGMGNKWSHETMDSKVTYEHKIRLFQEVRNSCFIDADASLWYIVLLLDAGFSLEQITAIQQEINNVIKDQLNGNFDDRNPAFGRLRDFFQAGSDETSEGAGCEFLLDSKSPAKD